MTASRRDVGYHASLFWAIYWAMLWTGAASYHRGINPRAFRCHRHYIAASNRLLAFTPWRPS